MQKTIQQQFKIMTINDKINFRANAWFYLTTKQYFQLIGLNLMVLAPYYKERLIQQGRHVADSEAFKSVYGKNRFEYENNI